jgi:L-aspartate oxidase
VKVEVTRFDRPIVVGSGVAGLTVALGLGRALVVRHRELGSSWYSQVGLAAALSSEDSPEAHAADTLEASGGVGDPEAIEVLTSSAPGVIDRLSELGVPFDRDLDGELLLSHERGHARPRVARCDGDATGAELMRSLDAASEQVGGVSFMRGRVIDLVSDGDRISGILVAQGKQRLVLTAPAVVLATGGVGRLFARTTSPKGIAGEGVAIAARAGAVLADLEFIRFHPTTLWIDKDPLPVLPEELLEEGATLVDGSGRPFVSNLVGGSSSGSGDSLSQVIYSRLQDGSPIFLDARAVASFAERFPATTAHAMSVGLHPSEHLLPIGPAAHSLIGGVKTDPYGRTSLPGLWAVGECASTGVHGAAGLEANTLLEAVVFGMRAADSVASEARSSGDRVLTAANSLDLPVIAGPAADELREIMWNHVGPVRSAPGLQEAESALQSMEAILNRTIEGRNALAVALMMIAAAQDRRESRGVHYRADHPAADPSQATRSELQTLAPDWADVGG